MRRILIGSLIALAPACGVEKLSGDDGGDACVPPQVQAVFEARCANMPACHGANPTPQVPLNLAAAGSSAIVGQQAAQQPSLALVELGNVDGSYLAQKMLQDMPASGSRMPVGADFTDPALQSDIGVVLGWIAGAELGGCDGGTGSETSAEGTGTTTDASSSESGETGVSDSRRCGLQDLDPGAANPIEAGDAAGQIPTEIGFLLVNNCGCHYSDGPYVRMVAPYSGMADLATLTGWQSPTSMTATMTALEVAATRVADEGPIGMPPPGPDANRTCDVGTGHAMPPDERARLLEWISAGGPDGASWPP